MQAKFVRAAAVLAVLAMVVPAFAQYGYPLKGTFSGDWWIQKGKENHLLIEFNYENEKDLVTGTYTPGPDGAALQKLTVTLPNPKVVTEGAKPWLVHFEVDTKDDSGKAVHLVFDGKLENIGAFNKHLSGTVALGGQKGEFKAVMQ
ncbi:MAG TPA: hypothetical protein VGK48_05495 [Terriglobia bacterium]|jgi:hypothetical protein